MNSLISDIQKYLKENYKSKSTIYSRCPENFSTALLKKVKKPLLRSAPPKIEKKKNPKLLKPTPTKAAPTNETPPKEAPQKESPPQKKGSLALQKVQNPKRAPSDDFRSFYGNFAPNFHVYEKPKDDALAKKVKAKSSDQKVLSDVVIFTDSSMNNYNRLLGNIAHAIEIKLCPCRLLDISPIEKSNRWENIFSAHKLHLIMIPTPVLESSPNLLSYHKDDKIGGVPLFLFEQLNEVQKNPEKKKALWTAITEAIKL